MVHSRVGLSYGEERVLRIWDVWDLEYDILGAKVVYHQRVQRVDIGMLVVSISVHEKKVRESLLP